MPYGKRNNKGKLIGIKDESDEIYQQWLSDDDSELLAFMQNTVKANELKQSLSVSDDEMIRVIDDLIGLLVEKQVFVFTELPEAVQIKLNTRTTMRSGINPLENLISESDDIY